MTTATKDSATNEASDAVGIRSSALFAIASEWRRDAEMHRNSCRLQEQAGRRDKADRHYQRSLDLDACAKRIEDLANNGYVIIKSGDEVLTLDTKAIPIFVEQLKQFTS